jgi:hypothetical protein
MDTRLSRPGVIEKLEQFFAARPEVMLAYIYGSFLHREDWRDLDIAVWIDEGLLDVGCDPFDHSLRLGAGLEAFLGRPGIEVDLRPLNDAGLPFQYEVTGTGRLVKRRDEETRVLYEARVMTEYLDFKWLLDMYDQALFKEIRQW